MVNFRASRFYKAKSWDLLLPRQKQKRNPLNVICSQILSICSLQFLVGFIVPANLSSKENNCPIVALTGINGLWRKPKNNKAFRLEALKDCESESILTYNFIKSRVPLERFFHCVLLIWNLHSFNQLAGIVIVLINIFHIIFINRYIGSAS